MEYDYSAATNKNPFSRNRKLNQRKLTARKYGYTLEILLYMFKTGIRWEVPINKST